MVLLFCFESLMHILAIARLFQQICGQWYGNLQSTSSNGMYSLATNDCTANLSLSPPLGLGQLARGR